MVAVAAAVYEAMSAYQPQRRYLVVPNEEEMAWVTGSAVQRLVELNDGHSFSYKEDELTNMIKSRMADLAGASQEPGAK